MEESKQKIFITSYPYVYERYFKVWDYFPRKEKLIFILPKKWSAKSGKIKVSVPKREDLEIMPVKAYFTHSHHPLVRGLLKGWMPSAKNIISKLAKPGDILYTAIEPNLLTTFFNVRLAKRLGMKHVFFTWQNIPYKKRLRGLKLKFTEWIIRQTVKNSAGAICGNSKAAEILREYASKDFKILISPISGVDTDKFRPGLTSDFRKKYNLENKIVFTFAGVFDERKGISLLLEAFADSLEKESRLHLVMIGTGPLKSFTENFVKSKKLENNITLIDWLPNEELPGIFANSDVFIHPSQPFGGWEEQFGYSMAEASASGLPVIATNTGSISEIVIDGKTGILLEAGDHQKLIDSMLKLAYNLELRKNMGEQGRRCVEENFSHRVVAEKFSKFFINL